MDSKSVMQATTSLANLRFTNDAVVTNKQPVGGLADNTNKSLNNSSSSSKGYINKIRRQSVSGKPKEEKRIQLVRTHSKVFFKPGKRRSSVSSDEKRFRADQTKNGSPEDEECPTIRIRNKMTRKPHGVDDLEDADGYAQDIIVYLQAIERKFTFPASYLKKGAVSIHMRAVLLDWLIQVQVHQFLSPHTLHLCANLIDKFLATNNVSLKSLQLLGITSLLLAAKFHERFPPDIDDLCHLTDWTYGPDQVLKMEILILKRLDFDLNMPGPIIFLERFLQINKCDKNDLISNMSMYLLDLMLPEICYVHFVPSMLAASAIYVSRELLGYDDFWNESYIYYTKYTEKDLAECAKMMRKSLSKLSKSQFQGAKTKYSHHAYCTVSKHESISKARELWPEAHDDDDVFPEPAEAKETVV